MPEIAAFDRPAPRRPPTPPGSDSTRRRSTCVGLSTRTFLCLLLLAPALTHARAHFLGSTNVDYDVASITSDGFEEISTWVSVDGVRNAFPGPLDSPPLAVQVIASQSPDPRDSGSEIGWWPLGSLRPGEDRIPGHREFVAPDLRAGDYWLHLRLVEDRPGEPLLDARTSDRVRRWRGGVDLRGRLFVDRSDPFDVLVSVPEIHNRQLGGDSGRLELRLYRTIEPGPRGDAITLCRYTLDPLLAGERFIDTQVSCRPPEGLPDNEHLHADIRPLGSPQGITLTDPPHSAPTVYAGSTGALALLLLGGLGARRRRIQISGRSPG